MFRTFELELRHLAFDDSGIGAVLAFRQAKTSDVAQQTGPEARMVSRVNELEFRQRITDQAPGVDKAETIRVEVMRDGRLVHNGADDKMSEQQSIQLLDHADRVQRTQRTGKQALMGIHFINRDFKFPALSKSCSQECSRFVWL